jgi:hypothetical protein
LRIFQSLIFTFAPDSSGAFCIFELFFFLELGRTVKLLLDEEKDFKKGNPETNSWNRQ